MKKKLSAILKNVSFIFLVAAGSALLVSGIKESTYSDGVPLFAGFFCLTGAWLLYRKWY